MENTKGRSVYKFSYTHSKQSTENCITNWLNANGFKAHAEKDGTHYFEKYDAVYGRFGLIAEYLEDEVILNVWVGKYKNPYLVEGEAFATNGNITINEYRKMLVPLFDTLQSNEYVSLNENIAIQFENTVVEKNKKMTKIAFWLSFIGLVLSLLGVTYGGIIIFFEYYFAIQGLKTSKRGMAITTIVMASVSVLILVCSLITQNW